MVVGGDDDYTDKLINSIRKHRFDTKKIMLDELNDPAIGDQMTPFGCIVGSFPDSKRLTELGLKIVKNPKLCEIPFEYILIPKDEYPLLSDYDNISTSFVSPLLLSKIDFFEIYEDSLKRFEPKCQIHDYMDLSQLLQYVIDNNIDGDVAEFGSYKGHCGYLISQILTKFGSTKRLWMFDMFEEFPEEIMGVDIFWNKSHQVDFSEVRSTFSHLANVTLVKGDFTETFKEMDIEKLCLVYIDCDSYRSTKFLLQTVYELFLARNGILIIEDYGHAPLLGSRIAFHEFFDGRKNCFKFFSQFSGVQIVVKTET